MSNNYYLKSIPKETYQKVLFLLSPKDLLQICDTDKYVQTICDDNFYREYIQRNYDPLFFGFDNWNNTIFDNEIFNVQRNKWKDILQIILRHKIIPLKINNKQFSYVAIHPMDSFESIRDKLIHYDGLALTLCGETKLGRFCAKINRNEQDVISGYSRSNNIPYRMYDNSYPIPCSRGGKYELKTIIGSQILYHLCKLRINIPEPTLFEVISTINISK